MANVLLGVTGSVAAIHTPLLFEALRQAGHAVKIVATTPSLYFFDPADPVFSAQSGTLIRDQDEWPGQRYQRGDEVVHIELRRWAELLLIAPLDANTLAKLAHGLADNCLTCVWRAWNRERAVVLAPAMNTLMWEHPLTARHLRGIAEIFTVSPCPDLPLDGIIAWINANCARLRLVAPISKRLACDDVGIGALAEREQILREVQQLVAE